MVLGRRNYLFAGSDAGGDTAARLYSLVGTCRLNGVDPHLYLRVRLNTLVESGARRFKFLYDFGDDWEHTINIEDLLMPSATGKQVKCLAGENACPPEDVGGPHAYFDFLAAIKDPAHEGRNTMLQWIGGSFDSVAFKISDVNERLAIIKT